jgi:hypothetical protein
VQKENLDRKGFRALAFRTGDYSRHLAPKRSWVAMWKLVCERRVQYSALMTKAQLEQKVGELEISIKGLQEDIMIITKLGKFDQQAGEFVEQQTLTGWNPAFLEKCRSFSSRYYNKT